MCMHGEIFKQRSDLPRISILYHIQENKSIKIKKNKLLINEELKEKGVFREFEVSVLGAR